MILTFIIIMMIIILPLRLQWLMSIMIITSSFIFYNDISTITIMITITIIIMIIIITIIMIL
jgi:hypothetical protein